MRASDTPSVPGVRLDRRRLLTAAAATAAGAAAAGRLASAAGAAAPAEELEEATVAELQAAMRAGRETSLSLVRKYVARIEALDMGGPRLNSVIEVNPRAEAIARALDAERRAGHVRGPLHGIPVLLKDNIDTADRLETAAGSLALVGRAPARDATVARKLRRAGAVILGKANLSEWANFRSFFSSSGWSGRAGQCLNPYVLDRSPCGSSSGSAAAVAASLCAVAVGTETDGSIVCPASMNGGVGLKPTVGLTSRAGVIPIAHSQDSAGPHARTVADAAALLAAMVTTTADPRDMATARAAAAGRRFRAGWRAALDPRGLRGARIGVPRTGVTDAITEEVAAVFEDALDAMREAGATVVDPAEIATIADINSGADEIAVLVHEFKRDLNAYLRTRHDVALDQEGFARTLAGLIDFNRAHAARELRWFGQEWFELAESDPFDRATYVAARRRARRIGGREGIDATLARHRLDALVVPTATPAFTIDLLNGDHFVFGTSAPSAIAGYPLVNVPAGAASGLPVGISLLASAFGELTLVRLAAGFEAAARARRRPRFLPSVAVRDDPRPRGGAGRAHAGAAARRPAVPSARRPLGVL